MVIVAGPAFFTLTIPCGFPFSRALIYVLCGQSLFSKQCLFAFLRRSLSTFGRVIEPKHIYEVRPSQDRRGVDLISDALPFDRLWYDTPDNAIGYAMYSSHSHDAVIRVYDEAGKGDRGARAQGGFQRMVSVTASKQRAAMR